MRSTAALRDRLAVGDDRERLERRRREPDGVRADVARDEGARLRRRSRARPGRRRARGGCPAARSDTSRSPRRASTVARSVPASARDLAPRQRPLGDEQERLEGGLGQLDRRAFGGRGRVRRRVELVQPCDRPRRRPPASAPRSRERLQGLVERRDVGVRRRRRPPPAPRPSSPGRRSGPTAPPARRRSRVAS